jgi:hypothetical protein
MQVSDRPLFLRMNALLWCPMTLRLIALVVSTACLSVAEGPLRFELRRVERKTEGCGVITFEYPVIISAASPEARDRINAGILRVLLRGTVSGPPQYVGRSLDNYTAQFFKNCREFRARDEAPFRELYEHKRVTIFRYTPPILSFRFDATADLGGVHPYGNTLFANFDSVTGETFVLSDILREGGYAKLEATAETRFRWQYKLSPSDRLSESFSFPGDRFQLNENFGFGEDELVFIFNAYEIAAGAAGSIEIRLPYALLREAMKPGLRLEW